MFLANFCFFLYLQILSIIAGCIPLESITTNVLLIFLKLLTNCTSCHWTRSNYFTLKHRKTSLFAKLIVDKRTAVLLYREAHVVTRQTHFCLQRIVGVRAVVVCVRTAVAASMSTISATETTTVAIAATKTRNFAVSPTDAIVLNIEAWRYAGSICTMWTKSDVNVYMRQFLLQVYLQTTYFYRWGSAPNHDRNFVL